MLPELRKIITENQKLLYTIRKRGENLPKLEKKELQKYLGVSFPTLQKSINQLKHKNIINIKGENAYINPSIAYFAGFYITEHNIELELIDFAFEPALEKIAPKLNSQIEYKESWEVFEFINTTVNQLSEIIEIESIAIIYDEALMDYKKNEIYSIIDDSIELHAASWILKTEPNNIVYRIFRTTYITENLLPYMLYLKEKVIESDCMVYYDLDENRVSYIKNNILCKEDNPMFGMIFPRLTKEQKKVLKSLEDLNDEEYINALNESKDFIIPFLDQASLQIRSILNPKYFVIGGKWIKAKRFGNFYESNQIAKYDCSFKHRILKEEPRIVNRHEQPQKGAGIYAAYSYFNWELKW